MEKSDFLDELRLKVGLAFDYANNHEDFLKKVVQTLYSIVGHQCMITVYEPSSDAGLKKRYVLGNIEQSGKTDFPGEGFLSVCGIPSSLVFTKDGIQTIAAPVISFGNVEYVLVFTVSKQSYSLSRQDYVFVDELVRFIGAKHEVLRGKKK